MLRFLSRPLYGALAVFVIAFIVYLRTLAPGVGFIDAGELATVVSTLGIAHPTGYPLFTLIGFFFAKLPVAEFVIVRLNIMSALFSALGAAAMVFLGYEISLHWLTLRKAMKSLRTKKVLPEAANTTRETKEHQASAAGIFAGLTMAFSETWWSNATSIEVYPLHVFLVPMALTFFLRMLREGENAHAKRDGYLFALLLGLSFANHLTTILLAPACLYMFFARFGFSGDSFRRIARLVPPFLIGLLPYLYLPLRSAAEPLMDWGNPETLRSFMKHVTGGQYKIWMFTGGSASKQFSYFWSSLPSEFSWFHIILGVLGVFMLFKVASRNMFIFLLLLFFGSLFYAINYDIHDIDSYFLLAYISFGLIVMAFMAMISKFSNDFTKKIKSAAITTLWFGALLGLIEVVNGYSDADESGNHMVDDFTQNMLANLPPNAIILSSAWDFWVSGAFYWQQVEKLRPDVTVIDIALLRDRPWYYDHLKQVAPDVIRNAQKELDAFMPHLERFDRGESYDGAAISATYSAFTEALVRNNSARPIYITSESVADRDQLFAPSFTGVPAGMAFRLVERDTMFAPPFPKLVWRDEHYTKRNYYADNARLLQAAPLAATASAFAQQGRMSEAKRYLDLALSFAPDPNVNIEKLRQRDRDFARNTDTRFAELAAMRQQMR